MGQPPPPPDAPPQIGRGLRPGRSVDLDFDLDAPPAQPLMPKLQNVDALLAKVNYYQQNCVVVIQLCVL